MKKENNYDYDYALRDYVFDIKFDKIVQITNIWNNGRVVVYTVKWLPPEQNYETCYEEQLCPLTLKQEVMLRLRGLL